MLVIAILDMKERHEVDFPEALKISFEFLQGTLQTSFGGK